MYNETVSKSVSFKYWFEFPLSTQVIMIFTNVGYKIFQFVAIALNNRLE